MVVRATDMVGGVAYYVSCEEEQKKDLGKFLESKSGQSCFRSKV